MILALFGLLAPAHAGVTQVITDVGRYTFSVDGWGNVSSNTGTVTINKPTASSTLKYAYASVTTIPFSSDPGASILKVGGVNVSLTSVGYDQVYTRYGDITSTVKSYFDALPAGANSVTMQETGIAAATSDGSALYVVWEDPSLDITTIALTLGASFTYYDPTITLAVNPVDTSGSGFHMIAGAAISYSAGSSYGQKSDFYFGSTRITTEAGGYDDGSLSNGALFTVGGDGDDATGEMYDLTTWATDGATSLDFYLHGYSPDDYCVGIWVEATSVTASSIEYCGDGIVNGTEECDDGNSDDTDACTNLCVANCEDADGDGYMDDSCGGDDCDDSDADVHPGATEYCNGVDDDCDGAIDDGAVDDATWYLDADGDAYGNPAVTEISCDQPDGYVDNDDDCDDSDADVHPYATEEPYDGIDQDCDGADLRDVDGDGYEGSAVGGSDCDDSDNSVHPSGTESADGVDEDCDGELDEGTTWGDDDGDGVTEAAGDCDDSDASTVPGAEEVYDGEDDDCDGDTDEGTAGYDDDGDGYSDDAGDCNDEDPFVRPGGIEVDGNGVDDDCDGVIDDGVLDDDGDGVTEDGGDCEPDNGDVHPGAAETANGVDDDCDGVVDEGTSAYDDDGDGYAESDGDCDDSNAEVGPDSEEVVNGRDDDCDGDLEEGTTAGDDDGDGWTEDGGDCNDADGSVSPDEEDVYGDGVDNDCSGDADEIGADADDDGYTADDGDCDDQNGWAHPGLVETCDGIDNNCDGVADEGCDEGDKVLDDGSAGCGCASGAPAGLAAMALAAGLVARRRRR